MDTTTLGGRLRQLRMARGKSLRVVAGLAGISHGYLSMLETGTRPLDRLSLIFTLARALDVAPAELIRPLLPPTTPGSAAPVLCGQCGRRRLVP